MNEIVTKKHVETACKTIAIQRKYKRDTYLYKNIYHNIGKENNASISAVALCKFNKNTGVISFSHCLNHKKKSIYPSTNKKLRCINEHTLTVIEDNRKYKKKNLSHKMISKQMFTQCGKSVSCSSLVTYNKSSKEISVVGLIRFMKNNIYTTKKSDTPQR